MKGATDSEKKLIDKHAALSIIWAACLLQLSFHWASELTLFLGDEVSGVSDRKIQETEKKTKDRFFSESYR
jgi:hypothetical protein